MMKEEKAKLKKFAGELLTILGTSSKVGLGEIPKIMKIVKNGGMEKMVEEKIDKLHEGEVKKVIELIKNFNEN